MTLFWLLTLVLVLIKTMFTRMCKKFLTNFQPKLLNGWLTTWSTTWKSTNKVNKLALKTSLGFQASFSLTRKCYAPHDSQWVPLQFPSYKRYLKPKIKLKWNLIEESAYNKQRDSWPLALSILCTDLTTGIHSTLWLAWHNINSFKCPHLCIQLFCMNCKYMTVGIKSHISGISQKIRFYLKILSEKWVSIMRIPHLQRPVHKLKRDDRCPISANITMTKLEEHKSC